MKPFFALILGLVLLGSNVIAAESHRATYLGNPATRFAPPLSTPDDLRARFADEKLRPDFAEVLRQWGWQGRIEDLFAAAAAADIKEAPIAVGETIPFMSTRRNGQPLCLRNVTWAGKIPAPAYAFNFTSNGRRYRCITPKACSNFFVVDQGPEPKPKLIVSCSAPDQVLAGREVKVCVTVINSGTLTEPKVSLSLPLPADVTATSLTDYGTVVEGAARWEVTGLEPNKGKEVCATLAVDKPGAFAFTPAAVGTLTGPVKSDCATKVIGIPAILLEVVDVADPIEVGKEVTYKIRVTNQGSATGTNLRLECQFDEAQEYVSASGSTKVSAEGRKLSMETVPVLAPKAAVEWEVVVKAAAAADARFRVEIGSDQFEQPISESEATQQY